MIKPGDLMLPYGEWVKKVNSLNLSEDDKQWLSEWESWDLACSPMDDKERRLIRYGHRLGWQASKARN